MLAMNVKSVSVQQVNSDCSSWYTQTLKDFAVVCWEKISSVHMQLNGTLRGVVMVSNVTVFYEKIISYSVSAIYVTL